MATPAAAIPRDLEQELRSLHARVDALTSVALGRRVLTVNEGDFVVSGGGSVVVRDGGNLQILDGNGATIWDALAGPIKAGSVQADLNTATFPDDPVWRQHVSGSMTVPAGYSRAFVAVFSAAGATFTGSGSIGALPRVTANVTRDGPGISTGGTIVPVSATSYVAVQLNGLTPGTHITVSTLAYRIGPVTAGSCNAHCSASAIFMR